MYNMKKVYNDLIIINLYLILLATDQLSEEMITNIYQ